MLLWYFMWIWVKKSGRKQAIQRCMCNRLVPTIESPKQLENFPRSLFTLQLYLTHRLKQRSSSSSPHPPCPPPPPPLLIIIIIIIIHHIILGGSYLGLPDAYHFFPPPSSVGVPYPLSGFPLECVHGGGDCPLFWGLKIFTALLLLLWPYWGLYRWQKLVLGVTILRNV